MPYSTKLPGTKLLRLGHHVNICRKSFTFTWKQHLQVLKHFEIFGSNKILRNRECFDSQTFVLLWHGFLINLTIIILQPIHLLYQMIPTVQEYFAFLNSCFGHCFNYQSDDTHKPFITTWQNAGCNSGAV